MEIAATTFITHIIGITIPIIHIWILITFGQVPGQLPVNKPTVSPSLQPSHTPTSDLNLYVAVPLFGTLVLVCGLLAVTEKVAPSGTTTTYLVPSNLPAPLSYSGAVHPPSLIDLFRFGKVTIKACR